MLISTGRQSSVCLSIPSPSCAGWHLPSQQGQLSGTGSCSSLSATQPGGNPGAVPVCLTMPGSRWGWDKSISAVLLWVAETPKSGAGGTNQGPSEAHSELPTAKSPTAGLGLVSLGSPTTISRLCTLHCSSSVLLPSGKTEYPTKLQYRATETIGGWSTSPLRTS